MKLELLDITDVWTALGGGPLRGKRGKAFWRPKADGFNVSVDREKGAWFDFRDCRGGGIFDLVMVAHNCDRPEALRWLELHCGLDPLRPLSIEEQRRQKLAQAEATELVAWRNSMLDVLRHERNLSFRLYHEGVQWIIKHGLDSELAGLVADVCDILEERALEAERGLGMLSEASWADLLATFREQRVPKVAT